MEIPTEDQEIIIRIDSSGTVMTEYALPISWAKAVPIPPHGRLGDLDALIKKIPVVSYEIHENIRTLLESAPTIIPTEEGE
jgi:hypothetical protein